LVNGKRIQSNLLRSGDLIEIGGNTFRFVESQPAQPQSNPRPQPNYPQNPQHYPPYTPPSDPYASSKDRTTAIILAFFLGGFGAHKLYLGDKNAFILSLLFCWTGVPTILAIIDGVTYLGMSDEGFRMKYSGR
jgi:TM2 domain-containing membrane protein YozV